MPRYTDIDKLIAEYDRVHVGPAGGARKLMVEAPTADVAPREEVARELLDEMEKTIRWALTLVGLSYKHNFKEIQCRKECYEDFLGYIAELKKKYTEGEK